MLAPLCAELCADIIEYQFISSFENQDSPLPSSSLFRVNPTKLDFAWTDIHFFSKALLRSLQIYDRDKVLRDNFVERVSLLVRGRYSREAKSVALSYQDEIESAVESFLAVLAKRTKECCDTEMPLSTAEMNEFFLLFTNLLQVQSTINTLMTVINTSFPELKRYQEMFVISVLTYFCESPLAHFWSMDEMISAWAIPFLKAVHQVESVEYTGEI